MIFQLFIGTMVIAATVAIHAEMLNRLTLMMARVGRFIRHRFPKAAGTWLIIFCVLFIMLAHTFEVWTWALVLMATGAVEGLEPAVYFSLVSFTTLGFGDIILGKEWRLLSALIGANGFLLFGWSTAYMVEAIRRVRQES
ncbi:MAG: ion channel [Hyphomicrobiales bacterium]